VYALQGHLARKLYDLTNSRESRGKSRQQKESNLIRQSNGRSRPPGSRSRSTIWQTADHCWGKRVQQLKKRKKSCFFGFWEKKRKKRKKTYI